MSGDLYQYFLAPDGEGAGYTLPYGTHRIPWCAEGRPLEYIYGSSSARLRCWLSLPDFYHTAPYPMWATG